VAAADFFRLPTSDDPFRETNLHPGELVTAVTIPVAETKSAYLQFSEKAEFDWALVSAAVSLQMSGANIASIRLVLGAVAQIPWRLPAVEKYLTGKSATDETILNKAADLAVADAEPLGKNGYKVTIAKAAVKRVIRQALGTTV
jgi:xanthine dehydrogenase YagS FAD-binding subunit